MYKRIYGCIFGLLTLAAATASAEERQNIFYSSDDEHEALMATPNASSGSCGVERWSVKTGTDADIGLVNLSSTSNNTIVTMRSWTAPNPIPPNNRVSPYETTDWVVNATLTQYKLETDSDYHLVIQDASGNTMIAEIPDPACVGSGSPFAAKIQAARAAFDAKYNATTSFQTANIPVQLTGVGMFDFLHGQTGVAPNGIELHPVLNIVFNPGNGNPDFALSAAPGSLSENQGASASTTISVTPSSGFTGAVGFTASGLPSGVSATFSPTSSSSSTTLTLSASSTAATGTAVVTITGTSGNLIHTATVSLTVNPVSGGGGQTAVYNSTLKAPWCATVSSGCDSGPSLLLGRASLSGGAEPNQPNTINNSCADGTSGTFHSDESNDRLAIATTDGSSFAAGKTVKVTATVWAYGATDALDLYSAANANSPSWVLLSTITPSAAGAQTLSSSFTLPAGNLQAVRANFRYQGSASPCSTGAYDDHDDLIFAVGGSAPADFGIGASPTSASVTQGSSATDTITITPQNGFSGSVALSASGLPSGVTASFNPSSTTGSSTLTFTASSTATTGTSTVTITGVSGTLTHTATISLTVNPAAAPNFAIAASPSSVSVTQGSSVGDTVTITPQNGFSSSVSLTATGLPSGVTAAFNPTSTTSSSTLTLTASSTATTGAATVTITGTSGGLTHSTTLSLTVNAGGGTATELIVNGGFESGTSPWTASTGVITNSASEAAHTGSYKAWLDGYGTATTDTLSQTVTIPSTATTATLSFWLHIDTAETTTTTAYDTLTVQLQSSTGTVLTTLATYSNLNKNTGYAQKSFDVSAYKGQTVKIYFKGVEDASMQTSFVIDDVSLKSQ
jgi:hypothetical protein